MELLVELMCRVHIHKVRSISSGHGNVESVIVSGIKGSDETVVDSSMYIGRQGITFPRLGKYILYIEREGMWIAVTLAVLLILIGCVPWDRNKKANKGGIRSEL